MTLPRRIATLLPLRFLLTIIIISVVLNDVVLAGDFLTSLPIILRATTLNDKYCGGRPCHASVLLFIPPFHVDGTGNSIIDSSASLFHQRKSISSSLKINNEHRAATTKYIMSPWHARIESTSFSQSLSMSSSSSSSNNNNNSPWAPGKWKITLDFGRDESSSSLFDSASQQNNVNTQQLSSLLGEEWGSSGSRLVLSFEIFVTTDTASSTTITTTNSGNYSRLNQLQLSWLGGKPTGTINCLPQSLSNTEDNDNNGNTNHCATYINNKGQQKVQISSGHWRIEPPQPLPITTTTSTNNILPGQASILRYHLTIHTPIERNTIAFPRDQLLLLQSNTFRTEAYRRGIQTLIPYQYAKELSQEALEEQLNHETGDRRLDGTDLLGTLEGYKDVAGLVWERDERYRRWREVEGALPTITASASSLGGGGGGATRADVNALLEDDNRWGVWPGDVEPMTVERGVILAVVAKKQDAKQKGGLFPWMSSSSQEKGEETVVVGRWSAVPVFDDDKYYNDDDDDDDEYEYYDEDEDEYCDDDEDDLE